MAEGKHTLLQEHNTAEWRGEKEERETESLVSAEFTERLTELKEINTDTHTLAACRCSLSYS